MFPPGSSGLSLQYAPRPWSRAGKRRACPHCSRRTLGQNDGKRRREQDRAEDSEEVFTASRDVSEVLVNNGEKIRLGGAFNESELAIGTRKTVR